MFTGIVIIPETDKKYNDIQIVNYAATNGYLDLIKHMFSTCLTVDDLRGNQMVN